MKPKRTSSSYLLLLGLMSLLTIGAWLSYQVYTALTKSQISEKQRVAILPLSGVISEEALNNLSGRRKFSEAELANLVLNISSSPSTASAENVATVSGGL